MVQTTRFESDSGRKSDFLHFFFVFGVTKKYLHLRGRHRRTNQQGVTEVFRKQKYFIKQVSNINNKSPNGTVTDESV